MELAVEARTSPDADGASGAVPLLTLAPELARSLPPSQRAQAQRELIAHTTLLRPGDSGAELFQPGLFAALIVKGALARRVCTDRGRSLEILIEGDLLRPWQEDSGWVTESGIDPLVETRVAVIDHNELDSLCKFPALMEAVLERAFQRIRGAATQAAFDSRAGMDQRVLFSMWHLADRCGEPADGGVMIPLPLTHQIIADLVGAQRTSVSAAISRLTADGMMSRTDGRGWMLYPASSDMAPARRTRA
jgi:CRP/FNR family cyclic AMP-dependent transcriptional regulator